MFTASPRTAGRPSSSVHRVPRPRQAGDDVLVVDRNPAFAEGLARLLDKLGHRASHATFPAAAEAASSRPFSVILLDADGGREELVTLAAALREAAGSARVILLVGDGSAQPVELARAAGALGCVSRRASGATLEAAIRRTSSGERLPPLVGAVRQPRPQADGSKLLLSGLTEREVLVLRAMMTGLRSSKIAELLGISPHTVRTHVQNILSKLTVHTRVEAGMLAFRAGLLPLSDAQPSMQGLPR